MTEYQKERINRMMRSSWESHLSHFTASINPLGSEADNRRHELRSYEYLAWVNGARETLELLGYSITYEDHSVPQIV